MYTNGCYRSEKSNTKLYKLAATHCDVNKLETMQRFASRIATHQWDVSYGKLLNIVCTLKLKEGWWNLKLVQVFKIVCGLCYFPCNIFIQHQAHSERLARKPHCPYASVLSINSTHLYQVEWEHIYMYIDEESQAYAGSLDSIKRSNKNSLVLHWFKIWLLSCYKEKIMNVIY